MADPILQIREGPVFQKGGLRGGGGLKNIFLALWASVWPKNKGGPGSPPGSWKECWNSLPYRTTVNQWITLSFLDGWVTCIGWMITDHQSSCYTDSSVYECVIKEGLCYCGSKTLLRERDIDHDNILAGECQQWTYVEKTYRSWTLGVALPDCRWKELDKTFFGFVVVFRLNHWKTLISNPDLLSKKPKVRSGPCNRPSGMWKAMLERTLEINSQNSSRVKRQIL